MKNTIQHDDNDLWAAILAGSHSAFEKLYSRYFKILFRYGYQSVNDEEIVNDAIQDLFLDIWRTRYSLGQAESVRYYLLSSLNRRIYRSVKKVRNENQDWETISEVLLPTQMSPEVLFTADEHSLIQTQKLNTWLSRLPSRQNEALVLRYYHNLEYNQIAALLEIKEQTARNLVQKAIQILRKMAIILMAVGNICAI